MIFHIQLTYEQYWTTAFVLFQLLLFYSSRNMFLYPHEREDDEEV